MTKEKIGDRVGAIRNADDSTVYLYGYGTYAGEEIPPKGTPGPFGMDAGELGIPNPKIVLDSGEIVWGCQCWWGPENEVKEMVAGRNVIIVPPPKSMNP